MAGNRVALLVATDTYDDQSFRRLGTPVADVTALQKVLEDPAIGGYAVSVLANVPSHEANRAINRFFRSVGKDDMALFYVSGHGYRDDDGRLYLVTRDSHRPFIDSTAVSAQFVREQLDKSPSKRKLVFLDCCNAGAFPEGASTKGAESAGALTTLSGRGTVVITASSAIEYAFEGEQPPVALASESAALSVFTGAVISGLATGNADLDGDGLVAIDEFYDYVYQHVKDNAPQQTPGWRSEIEGKLYIAASPQGVRPAPLPPEILREMQSWYPPTRLGVVSLLAGLCDTSPPMKLAAQDALTRLADDDSRSVSEAAIAALAQTGADLPRAGLGSRQAAEKDVAELRESAIREAARIVAEARSQAAGLLREAEQRLADARAMQEQAAAIREQAESEARERVEAATSKAAEMLSQAYRDVQNMQEQAKSLLPAEQAGPGNHLMRLIMPQLGEKVTEGTVTRWLKKQGDFVAVDEPLVEISTDKVDTEILAPASGIVRQIDVDEDETVAVGATLALIDMNPELLEKRSQDHGLVKVTMPSLGEKVTEGTVTRWLKKRGEFVQADEPLLEVSTDKVDTEIPAPASGIVRRIDVDEDETVAVGATLAIIDTNPDPVPAAAMPDQPRAVTQTTVYPRKWGGRKNLPERYGVRLTDVPPQEHGPRPLAVAFTCGRPSPGAATSPGRRKPPAGAATTR